MDVPAAVALVRLHDDREPDLADNCLDIGVTRVRADTPDTRHRNTRRRECGALTGLADEALCACRRDPGKPECVVQCRGQPDATVRERDDARWFAFGNGLHRAIGVSITD